MGWTTRPHRYTFHHLTLVARLGHHHIPSAFSHVGKSKTAGFPSFSGARGAATEENVCAFGRVACLGIFQFNQALDRACAPGDQTGRIDNRRILRQGDGNGRRYDLGDAAPAIGHSSFQTIFSAA
jgi:hypothetical protein